MHTVKYRHHNLARNSEAHSLYDKSEFAKLDALLKDVDQRYKKLQGGDLPEHLIN
jgi:hypothetical protein